jgi:hypothetical protein
VCNDEGIALGEHVNHPGASPERAKQPRASAH